MNQLRKGFTIVELLVAIGIVSILTVILLPALNHAKRQARRIACINNQHQIVNACNLYALNNNDRYPPSVATVGFGGIWNWSDPRKLIGKHKRTPASHRAISEYLGDYIQDAEIMFCPSAPKKYKWLQEAWQAGDNWDNPDTAIPMDPLGGTYCFWWNYVGYLSPGRVFTGPKSTASKRRHSKMIVSDFFGYGQCQDNAAFGSSEDFKGANITRETWLMSAYWISPGNLDSPKPALTMNAAFSDGRVETFAACDTVTLFISKSSDGQNPYPPPPLGSGVFFLAME